MKKLIVLSLAFCLLFSGMSFAGVQFLPAAQGIGSGGSSQGGKRFERSSAEKCKARGYRTTRENCNGQLINACPDDSSYFKTCCGNEYQYTKEECLSNGLRPSSKMCGGKYFCY